MCGYASSGLAGPKGNLETFIWLADPERVGLEDHHRGPVADPAGAYGVMIVNAPSRAMLEDWQAKDPVMLAGRGFAFETYPMPSIRVAPVEPLAPVSSVSP